MSLRAAYATGSTNSTSLVTLNTINGKGVLRMIDAKWVYDSPSSVTINIDGQGEVYLSNLASPWTNDVAHLSGAMHTNSTTDFYAYEFMLNLPFTSSVVIRGDNSSGGYLQTKASFILEV